MKLKTKTSSAVLLLLAFTAGAQQLNGGFRLWSDPPESPPMPANPFPMLQTYPAPDGSGLTIIDNSLFYTFSLAARGAMLSDSGEDPGFISWEDWSAQFSGTNTPAPLDADPNWPTNPVPGYYQIVWTGSPLTSTIPTNPPYLPPVMRSGGGYRPPLEHPPQHIPAGDLGEAYTALGWCNGDNCDGAWGFTNYQAEPHVYSDIGPGDGGGLFTVYLAFQTTDDGHGGCSPGTFLGHCRFRGWDSLGQAYDYARDFSLPSGGARWFKGAIIWVECIADDGIYQRGYTNIVGEIMSDSPPPLLPPWQPPVSQPPTAPKPFPIPGVPNEAHLDMVGVTAGSSYTIQESADGGRTWSTATNIVPASVGPNGTYEAVFTAQHTNASLVWRWSGTNFYSWPSTNF